ncbi:filamentous hemagglutinin N-terminal domain-containing protein [Duganella sp. FT92W]|uniref:Filamentous hemagglutinin N-terminal domain-containing protein n=1 Tax=Pseudoduganella rivuli TaxID=2666085 RepID=A0A7X2IMP4_9BURK|nr:filamentous hemagglutinin N-terminal domain-containing protein [Pseudoduganella rivuli]MRV72412.1 filamentous hemagglutinin N-terminal domain-containing protein [Pseudoduganella rivuli]
MSAPDHAARMSPVSVAAIVRYGRHKYTLIRRMPRRVAPLLVRMMARLLGARAAWGRTAAALALLTGLSAHAAPLPSNTLPTGATLAAGQATVAQSGNRMDIVQQSGKAILNWDTFNIGSGAAVTFRQPGADSVILNRVASNAPSLLQGSLSANGKVWLVNPAGIMVGQGATLDLHGFVASTLAVRDADFLAGRMLFNATPQAALGAMVRNDGTIATPSGGSVYLVGPDVQNHGVIRAPNGEVLLAAGASVELLDTATPGVRVAVTGTGGSALNLGQIVSTAGRIGMAGVLVKNSGVLNASSVVSEGGRIFLRATQSAVADGAAQMLATGSGSGGRIEMTGDSVAVQGTALLDASGGQGGGTVLVGGDYQGGGSLSRAQTALLGADAVLRADALASGDGGKVVLWSDRATAAQGTISARGGAQSGDGGMVETSGLRHLSIDGLRTDTTAARGKTGTLLLDPANIIIGAVADVDGTGLGGDAGVLAVDPAATVVTLDAGTYAGNTSKMTAGSIATLLATTSVSLAASTDITVDSKIEKTAGGDQSLTLNAGRDIVLRQPINSTSGKLGLNLTAGRTIQSDTFGSQSLNGGALTATAAGDLSLSNAVAASVSATSTSGSVVVNAPGALNLSGSAGSQYVVTAGGDVTLTSLTAGGDIGMNVDGHQILFKGGTLASGGNQYYQGNLALAGGTTVNSGGTVDFVGNLGGTPGLAFALGVTNTGLATFGGVLDNVASLNVSGTSLLKGNVTTVGAQSYGGQVRIAGPVVLKGSSVTLGGGGLGNAGLAAAPLTIQAQNTALSGTFEGFARVNTGGSLAVTSLAMPSQWFHTGALALANNGTLSASGGTTLTGPVTLGTDAVLTLAATAADTVSGGIGGAGSIVKSGAGATAFNSANTFTGGTTVNGGTLTVGAANALGSGDLTIGAAGTLDTAGFAQTVNSVSSAGTISAATGTLTATNGFTLTGGTVSGLLAGGGMAQMAGAVTLSGSYSGGAIRVLGGGMTIGSAGLQAGAALLQTASGTTLAINGPTATANLLNNGVVDLGAALNVAGGVSENAGAININGAAGQFAMAAGTAFTNVAAGSVTLAGTHATPVSGGGTFANAGTFSKTSAGAQTAVLTSNTGTVSVSSGTLTLSGMAANGGTLTVGNGATVATSSGTLANGADGVLAGSGTIAANVVNQGTLSPGGAGAIGTLAIDGTLDTSAGAVNTELTSAASYDKVAATGAVTVGAATVINRTDLAGAYASGDAFDVVQSTATQLAGTLPAVSGFDVEKASPSYHALRLTSQAGDNFWILKSGGTYVSGAWDVAANWLLGLPTAAQMVHIARPDTLTVTLNGTSGPASISGLDLGKANTLALTGKAALALGDRVSKLAGVIDVGGGSVLSRAGDLALAATGVLQGSGTVDVGSGMFTNNGKVIPGGAGIGTLQIKGNYTQGNGGVLAMELGGHGAGQSDLLAVTGKAVLDGALTTELMGSYKPVAFQPIAIVTAGERAGTFSKMTLPTGYQPGYGLAAGEAVRVNQVADANYFSNGAGTLAWDDGDNWSKRKAPGNADDVVIDTGLGLVAGAGKQAMSTLRITPGAVLDVNASQFDVKRGAVIDGTLRVNGEAAAVTLDTVTGGGALALGGGALALTGKTPTVGAFTITGGAADISKAALTVGSYTQGGGELKGDGTSSLTATSAFSQTGGVVTGLGTLDLTQASGALTLGNITANAVNAKATAGSIVQTDGMALAVGLLQVAASGDVLLPQANTIAGLRGSAGGALSVQGVAAVDGALSAGGDIALAGAGLAINAGVTSTGGNVTLQADEVDVYGGSTVASAGGGANFVKVNSLTAAQPIKFSSLGGEDTGTGLLLNARDMAAFTTPTLVLGDASHTGAISFMDGGDIAAPNVSGTLRFVNNGAFSRNGGETITANGLEITATGGILLGGVNHVKSFAASNGGSGDIVFTNNSGAVSLALGALANPVGAITVDNTGGIAASGPGAITASGKVTLTAHSPVVINTGVTSGTGIQVTASTGITLGAAARLTNTARGPVTLLAQNGNVVLDPASRIDSGGGSTTLEARGPGGAVVAPAGSVTGGLTIASTELDNIAAAEAAAQAAAEAEAKAAAEAAAKAAADKAAAEAAAKAAADAAAKKAAAEAAAKAAAEKAAAEAAAKAAADKAAAEAAAKAAADKAAAEAAAKAAADKAAAEAAAKAAAEKAAAEAAAEAAAKAAAEKAAAEAAAKAAAEQAAAEAAAKAAAEAAAKEAAEKAAAEAAAKAAEQAAAEAAAKAAADKAAADAAAKAAADAAAKAAAEKAAADAAAQAAAKAAADEAARQAADNAAKAAANSAKQPVQQPPQPAQDNKSQDSKPPENKPKETTPAGIAQESAPSSSPATVPSSPASAALAQAFEQQTIGGGADSFGGGEGTPAGDHKDGKDEKEGKGKDGGKGASGDGKDKKAAKKMAVCR